MRNLIAALTLLVLSTAGSALERKEYADISMVEITADTQAQPENSGDSHVSMIWWVPFEYWASVFHREQGMTDSVREETLSVLREYTVIAIVQADISALGSFDFYSKEQILNNLKVSYQGHNQSLLSLSPDQQVSGDMQLLMSQVSPILKAAMGNLGSNFHFFIYRDIGDNGQRVVDPYQAGKLSVNLKKRDGLLMNVEFEAPLNSLFVPRICPNGKKAHVSWHYCPWSGEKI